MSVCLSVCLSATLRKNFRTDLHEIFREGWQWVSEQVIKFCWRSGSPFGYSDCFPDSSLWEIQKMINGHSFIPIRQVAALVRRALADVCSVPVLLVLSVKLTRSHAAKYRANTLSLNPFSVSLSHLPCRYVKFSV